MEATPHHHLAQLAAAAPRPLMTPAEFAEAYQKGRSKTVRFLVSRGVGPDTAEEVAQDAWGQGWMKRTELLNFSAIVPWVNTIALNIFRGRIRRQPVSCIILPEHTVEPSTSPESIDVSRVLRSCDEEERFLIQAKAAGYTSQDLAQMKGCKSTTIRVRVMRLRRRLALRYSD